MRGTMTGGRLGVGAILRHARHVYGQRRIVTKTESGHSTRTFAEAAERAARLAGALRGLGITGDERVGTFQWNNAEHVEAYFAIPAMGAVLHTLNIRLAPEQVAQIANHAQDQVVIVDESLVPLFAKALPRMSSVREIIVNGPLAEDSLALLSQAAPQARPRRYEDLLAAAEPVAEWPDVDEDAAAAMCYTSGTTGDPKGVVYSHRSVYLHSSAVMSVNLLGLSGADRALPIVPMFHANAWGLVHAAFLAGCDLIMPGPFLGGEAIAQLIHEHRVTVSTGVPTVWADVLRYAREHKHELDFSSLRGLYSGGSAVPVSLMKAFRAEFGVDLVQLWGMTETSPVANTSSPRDDLDPASDEYWRYRSYVGKPAHGVEIRIVDEQGRAIAPGGGTGEIEARGLWVTTSYYLVDAADKFRDGWLRTGDVGELTSDGYLAISDRTKDVIKSGGEWISSVDLENHLMAHPCVREAAVVAVPCEIWGERPLACVVLAEAEGSAAPPKQAGGPVDPAAALAVIERLRAHLASEFPRWQVPEHWAFIDQVPRTSVGKFDKKALRQGRERGDLAVTSVPGPKRG
ncbi:AMP-dependent synthetase and ligase [Segniliparus rotundus DSM 44985]|uniref:AMP-dependent synthetase and ligase n=1 Tax=Segniliparus rotundus (strain ATCC BAA-972 / CDC 1076 / CIP 108378 / DSM 44985 / JCM 13578) TaxID=640132 RepID=D6ZAN1_SEGRD|nr:long-chain-fatty-acid--CoA ligase [Segniliparus rotundus]ADG98767.1 AMP-dependent synthetase and ligase [Segniliparus rotundus DSM 44985]